MFSIKKKHALTDLYCVCCKLLNIESKDAFKFLFAILHLHTYGKNYVTYKLK